MQKVLLEILDLFLVSLSEVFVQLIFFDEYNEFYESVMAWENNCSQQY